MGRPFSHSASHLVLLATTALAGAFCTMTAPAQAQNQETLQLDEITVTARRRDESLRDIPFTVDVQTRAQLDEKRGYDAPSALKDVAGVYMPTFGDRSTSFLIMRGVGPVLYPLGADDSSVLTFVDGTPLPIGSSNANYLDLERVEVLKGPQSTLFGRNTSGGAVNLVPVLPDETWKGYLRTEYGTQNQRMLEGAVGGPLIPEKLGARVAFRLRGIDGYVNNVVGPDLGREQSATGRLTLLFTPTDRTRWLLSASADSTDGVPVYYTLKGDGFPILAAQSLAREVTKNYAAQSKFEHRFEHFTFTSQTSYNAIRADLTYNGADYFLGSRITGLPLSAFSNIAGNYFDRNIDQSRFTQELRLSANPGETLQWVAGLSYYRDEAKLFSMRNVFLYGPAVSGFDNLHQTTTGQAIFGEVTYPVVVERLKLSVGGRYTRERKDYDGEFFSDGTPGTLPVFFETGKKDYNFWTGRAALSYDWSDKVTTFGSISRGYKSGGFGTFNTLMWAGVPRTPYDSSSVISYELGGRGSFFEDRLKLTGALFFNDVSKEQILTYDLANFATQSLNLDTQSYGFELDATWRADEHWEFAGGLTYTSTEITDVPAAAAAAQPGLKKGNQLPQVPEWAGKASVTYRTPLATLGLPVLGSANFLARIGYNYIGPRYSEAGNLSKLNAVHLLSARLGIEWEKGEAYLFGENLLDKRYVTFAQPYGNSVLTGGPVYGTVYARGATLGIGAAVKF